MTNLIPTTFMNHQELCDILNAPFTRDELQYTIGNLKNNKAVGFHGITNEMVKKLPRKCSKNIIRFHQPVSTKFTNTRLIL